MSTNELQWMVDVETSTGVVRAELTTDGRLECADRRVLAALDALGTEGETWVRPINSALGMAVVSPDDPESMASFVYSVLLHADPNLGEVTFFGTRCLPEVRPRHDRRRGRALVRASREPIRPDLAALRTGSVQAGQLAAAASAGTKSPASMVPTPEAMSKPDVARKPGTTLSPSITELLPIWTSTMPPADGVRSMA